MKKNNIIFSVLLTSVILLASCSGYLDDNKPTDKIPADQIKTLQDAIGSVNGLYIYMKWNDYYGLNMMSLGDVRGDDLRGRTASAYQAMTNYEFSPTNNSYDNLWARCYNIIMNANIILTNWDNVPAETPAEIKLKNDVKGQALAVRALCHFDLARLYGYPYQMNNGASLGAVIGNRVILKGERMPRATVKQTYDFVIKDLLDALPLLSDKKNWGHINYWAAKGLLARVYLYMGDYDNAFKHADELITDSRNPYKLTPNGVYVTSWAKQDDQDANDTENLLELIVTLQSNLDNNGGTNSWYYPLWHGAGAAGASLLPTNSWLAILDEDPADVRHGLLDVRSDGQRWLKKFPGWGGDPKVNNPKVIRLSEVYLIAAEAALMKSPVDQGKSDLYLDAIRKRANPASLTITATVDDILKERRKEFIGEGHRFFDLSRLGRTIDRSGADHAQFISIKKFRNVKTWDEVEYYQTVLPLSNSERIANPEAAQNPGYAN